MSVVYNLGTLKLIYYIILGTLKLIHSMKYISWKQDPDALQVDAFLTSWTNYNFMLFLLSAGC